MKTYSQCELILLAVCFLKIKHNFQKVYGVNWYSWFQKMSEDELSLIRKKILNLSKTEIDLVCTSNRENRDRMI